MTFNVKNVLYVQIVIFEIIENHYQISIENLRRIL